MKPCVITLLLLAVLAPATAQTQDEFMSKISDVYVNAADQKKALESAKAAFAMVEKTKDLQNYSNYVMLTQLFENQAPDADLAKQCKAKAEKLLNAMIGTTTQTTSTPSNDPQSKWLNELYPALFATTDPQNATRASDFLKKHPELQTFDNLTYVAYAYERNGDFENARKNYEAAIAKEQDPKTTYHSFAFYTNFLSRSGEYLKAEEYINKMEKLSTEASEYYKSSYKSESLTSRIVYYLAIGDYASYLQAANDQLEHTSKITQGKVPCESYTSTRFTYSAHAKEMLKQYSDAMDLWRKRDSSYYAWIDCHNKTYPNYQQYSISMLPVFQVKTGQKNKLAKPASFYIEETEKHYNSHAAYHDMQTIHWKAVQLAFLGSQKYHELFQGVMAQVENTKDFRESTLPFSNYAYFTMRDRQFDRSAETYGKLFALNVNWINDIIFTFGEKAFVTYYNTKLKDGYDNYHSFVKLAKQTKSPLSDKLAGQAYNNLLFTKSLSLKGTQKRKQAFRKTNDPAILKMYDEWIEKKQLLIRTYRKFEGGSTGEPPVDPAQLKKLQDEVNHLEDELTAKAKDFKKYLKLNPPDWKDVRARLKEGEAAIEMVRFQWRDKVYYSDTAYYAAYYITKDMAAPDVVYFSYAEQMDNRWYRLYQNNIKFKIRDTNSYDNYILPIMRRLKGIKKIYFSPDGIYHLINIPTLFNSESGKYLLDEVDFQYTTSSTDILESQDVTSIKTAALFGRPWYEMNSTRNILASITPETRSFTNFKENSVADLPGTEEEVLTIKKEMDKGGIQSAIYLHDQATEEKIYQLKSPDIMHIATHGYWSQSGNSSTDGFRLFNAMVNSGLLLTGVVNYYRATSLADTHDGILTAYEAQNLELDNTSLVILSACETSLGHMDAGEGVYGLQRAFRAAGAKSIMTSLWKVDDAATKEFMILFYSGYLTTKNKFSAFQNAQRKLKEKYPDPYYWGAFVLSGT